MASRSIEDFIVDFLNIRNCFHSPTGTVVPLDFRFYQILRVTGTMSAFTD